MYTGLRDAYDLYKEYLTLYQKADNLFIYETFDETWEVLEQKQGFNVKYVDIDALRDFIPMDINLLGENGFYHKNPCFYLIPNEIDGTIVSFILRGLQHDYVDYKGLSDYKPLFGIFNFSDFKYNQPIILTEGVKDCIILQKSYPYTLAILGAGITKKNLQILSKLTSKIILAYDNDETGIKKTQESKKSLLANNLNVLELHCPRKDFGLCLDLDFKDEIQNLIKAFPVFSLRS